MKKKIAIYCKIKDIQTKPNNEWAIVSVEVKKGKKVWHKPYRVRKNEYIDFKSFKAKLLEQVIDDLQREENIKELIKRKNKIFKLEVDQSKILKD